MRPSIPLGILAATAALTVPADTLRALIHARKGDVYDVHNLYLNLYFDLIALWNTGRFEDVGIETQPAGSGHPLATVATGVREIPPHSMEVVFHVDENPQLNHSLFPVPAPFSDAPACLRRTVAIC